jgi:predicted ATPase/class 3 adenylate cyclase
MAELPTGTVAFLFTDVQNSTMLLERAPQAMDRALRRHHDLLREAVERHDGHVFETVGDAVYAVFAKSSDAVAAAVDGQIAMESEMWGESGRLRVRMGVHAGEVELRENGHYFGAPLFRCARLMSIGHGGQVLLSGVSAAHVREALPPGSSLKDLGRHRLKDLSQDEHVFQLVHSRLQSDFPPLKSLESQPNNLPLQVTSFIGREKELARVKELLTMSRLLTLTGAGGSGKTRLAIQAAADLFEKYPDGMWFVDLAPLALPELVPQTVASAIGIREDAGQPILKTLLNALAEKKTLVVLDNCEHIIHACARMAETLVRACPAVSVLATSREALLISGETTWQVPPLTAADPERMLPVEQLTQCEAVRLFVDRAESARPEFVVNKQNAPTIAQICYRLDGIPLAIELAAARIKVLSLEQIASRLDDRFRLLTGGSRTALPRQQTLLALVNWSYDLLSEDERVLFRRLSVFVGGWTLDAAEQVCAGNPIDAGDVLDLLTGLIDKSLVLAELQPDNSLRYRMLETLRQYGRERLADAGESGSTTASHRAYFVRLAEALEPSFGSRTQLEGLTRMRQEHDNFRAILSNPAPTVDEEELLRLAAPLSLFCFYANFWSEERTWLDAVVSRHQGPPTLNFIRCLAMQGYLTAHLGDADAGDAILQRARDQAVELGSDLALSWVLVWMTILTLLRGEFSVLASTASELRNACARAGFEWGLALGELATGVAAAVAGRGWQARHLLEAALSRSRKVGDRMWIAFCLTFLAETAASSGDFQVAAQYLAEALPEHRELGSRGSLSVGLRVWGYVALLKGDVREAAGYYSEGLSLAVAVGKGTDIAGHLAGLANVAAALDRPVDSVRLFGAAEEVRESCHAVATPPEKSVADKALTALRRKLGEHDFRSAFKHGRDMSVDEAVLLTRDITAALVSGDSADRS